MHCLVCRLSEGKCQIVSLLGDVVHSNARCRARCAMELFVVQVHSQSCMRTRLVMCHHGALMLCSVAALLCVLQELLEDGNRRRKTDSTDANAVSSRSHAVRPAAPAVWNRGYRSQGCCPIIPLYACDALVGAHWQRGYPVSEVAAGFQSDLYWQLDVWQNDFWVGRLIVVWNGVGGLISALIVTW
jgi:hypothetical protein